MRVIDGEKRHILLKTLSDLSIRPTTDKIKETLFNMIQFQLNNVNFLDLFAGSGAIGIEALSRGAKSCIFVDNNREAINVINENLDKTILKYKSKVVLSDICLFLDSLEVQYVFDIMFLDPPYNKDLYIMPLIVLHSKDYIDGNTIFILETTRIDDVQKIVDLGYQVIKEKIYKNNKYIFLRKI